MYDGLTSIRCLDPQLQRFKNLTGPLGDQVHGYLTSESADSLSNRDRPQRPVRLAKSHDGSPANVWSGQFWNFPPEQEADHLKEKPKKQVGRSRAQRIADVRRTEPRPARTRSRRERRALRTWSTSAEGAAPGAIRRRVPISKLKHMCAWCRYTRGRFESAHGGFSNVSQHTHRTHTTHTTHTTTHTHTPTQTLRHIHGTYTNMAQTQTQADRQTDPSLPITTSRHPPKKQICETLQRCPEFLG